MENVVISENSAGSSTSSNYETIVSHLVMKSGLKLIVKTRLPQRHKLFPLELVLMYILVLNSSKERLTGKNVAK